MIWPFLKKKQAEETEPLEDRQLGEVTAFVKHLGYDLLPYGAGVALTLLASNYNAAETATLIVVASFAKDVLKAKETADLEHTMKLAQMGIAILEVFKDLKDRGMLRHEIWSNDATAIHKMMVPGPEAIEWVNQVLSDPIVSKELLAKSRVL